MFFDGTDRVHRAMRRVVELFDERGIEYAIIGGMAVNAHGHHRTTQDVDFLVRPESLVVIRSLVAQGLLRGDPARARRFFEPTTDVRFDVLTAGSFPGSGDPGPIAFPDPTTASDVVDDFRVINLRGLIELKLAAGRYQDLADVVNLIRANHLDNTFPQQLHESIREDFIECYEEMRRDDEYDRRQSEGR